MIIWSKLLSRDIYKTDCHSGKEFLNFIGRECICKKISTIKKKLVSLHSSIVKVIEDIL